jgi:hypothetical protein
MRLKTLVVLGLGLALASSAAFAFEEQQATMPGAAPAAAAAPAAELNTSSTAQPASGTEVRVPGLGKLGILPKMDFGLELLYGANDKPGEPETQEAAPGDDVTIRGSVKHKF